MKTLTFLIYSSLFSALSLADNLAVVPTVFRPSVLSIVDPDQPFEVLAEDIGWAEGPVWSDELNALLFSDIERNTILQWNENKGLTEYLSPSGNSLALGTPKWGGANGLLIDRDGSLVLAQQGGRTLAKMVSDLDSPTPVFQVIASTYLGRRLNSPNDLVMDSEGTIYFTDPPYGLEGFDKSPLIELPFSGIFALNDEKTLTVIDDSLRKPNGILLTKDNRFLLVSDSEPSVHRIWRYELNREGGVKEKHLFFDAYANRIGDEGSADGLKEHSSGLLFVTLPGGMAILSGTGELMATFPIGFTCNLAFDSRYHYIYITQPHRLLRLRLRHSER